MIGHVDELLGEEPDVERVEHGAHARDGEVGLHVALVVPHKGADPFTGLNAERGESGGELVGPVGNFGKGGLADRVGCVNSEDAGIGVAIIGSFAMMCVVLLLALPIGVAASIYLEEFAPENRLTDFIEVNVANLAAVPSIIFGILGLAFFINMMHLPQSAPLVGGLVLTLMTLPTIIISTRAALKAVPPSIRSAALGVGASKMQTTIHHVLPLAAPGILTGTILGLAQALGETAPLLLIGMIGYVATNMPETVSQGLLSPNSAMPAQIYEWAKRADPAFYERAWGGIIILLIFLVTMNLIAVRLRRRFERRW